MDTIHQEAIAAAQPRQMTHAERSSENKSGNDESTDAVSTVDSSVVPGLRVHKFGSWEPRHYEGEHGRGTVIGPVGYYASWGHEGDREEDKTNTQEGGDQKKEEQKNEEATASGEA